MKLSDIRFPFTVKRITSTQDSNGNPVEVDSGYSSKCGFKSLSVKEMMYLGQDLSTERAEITFYAVPEREILSNDVITVRGKSDWIPEGRCRQIEEGRNQFFKQMIKRG